MFGIAASTFIPAALSAAASIFGQERANRTNQKEAGVNRAFQERMRNTEWQAAVEDMRKAGINPAVAYSHGGASSPGGSQATVEDSIGKGSSSAMQALAMRKNLELLDAQITKTRNEGESAKADAMMRRTDLEFSLARREFYFDKDGTAKGPLLELLRTELGSAQGHSALQLAQADNLRFTTEQQKALMRALEKMGAGGDFGRILGPILLNMSRR